MEDRSCGRRTARLRIDDDDGDVRDQRRRFRRRLEVDRARTVDERPALAEICGRGDLEFSGHLPGVVRVADRAVVGGAQQRILQRGLAG